MSQDNFDTQTELEELRKLSEDQTMIFDSLPAWIFYKNKENTFIRVNKSFCNAMGKSKTDLEGKSLFEVFPKDQAEAFWKDDKDVIESGISKKNIVEQVEVLGRQRIVRTSKLPYKDKNGEVIGVIGFTVDITDQEENRKKIKESLLILQKIIDLIPIRIFWKDKDLKYLGCNQVFALDSGKQSVDEIIGKDDFQMGWEDQAELYRKDDLEVITSGKSKINYEEMQTTPDGHTIWLNTNKVPLTDNDGNIIGVLGTYMDITDRKLEDDKLKNVLEDTKKMNELMVGREMKMIELKSKIEELENQLKSNSQQSSNGG
jgi:PAS domain S-box-containing protein